jgi:pyridoxal phosphate enzyme (YggS family)
MSQLDDAIVANLQRVRAAIAQAAHDAGRSPDRIKLVAVSKTQPAAAIEAAIAAGQTVFGENTVQEALTKIPALASHDLEWHFIGHLQSNKARFIPDHFAWLHSLDSLKLAQRLSRLARERGAIVQALIEVNIARDPNKSGVLPEALMPLLEQLLKEDLPGLPLRGLMAIGPYPAAEADIRRAYAALRALRDDCRKRFALGDFTELSMGMSGDYVEAIQEGSTLVRIGTAIFGERDYSGG